MLGIKFMQEFYMKEVKIDIQKIMQGLGLRSV